MGGIAYLSGDDKVNAVTAIKIYYLILAVRYTFELLKAYFFADVLAPVKVNHLLKQWQELTELCSWSGVGIICSFFGKPLSGEGIVRSFADRAEERRSVLHTFFYIVKNLIVFIPAVMALQFHMGDVKFPPLMDMIPIGASIVVPRFVLVYFEFIAM